MLFNSFQFVVFFPVALAVYFVLPARVRWVWLLLCSYAFYMAWRPAYVVVIWLLTLVDYAAGLAIGAARTTRLRRVALGLSLASNLSLLFLFKYFNFANATASGVLGAAGIAYDPPFLDVVLPLGISFHTFQALSYTIDVYKGRQAPERHLGRFALFIAFFPQLVAGPIERAWHMLPQLAAEHAFDYERAVSGAKRMAWGFYKKLVVADRLALYVNDVYGAPREHTGLQALVATYAFAVQIYCDFSGYSDIAIGAARMMGIELTTNFRRPYFADSIGDFWRRWHISLSTWFRDYMYVPLGGNRVGPWRHTFNLAVVFLVSGLWHGASWTFVVWGALHGLYMIVGLWTERGRATLAHVFGLRRDGAVARVLRTVVTFHLVLVAWVFFRAETLKDAWRVVASVATDFRASAGVATREVDAAELGIAFLFVVVLEAVQLAEERGVGRGLLARRPTWMRWTVYVTAVLVILLFGRFDARAFIYFQF